MDNNATTVMFFSKSKGYDAKYLSNFTVLTIPLCVADDYPIELIRNKQFPSVEHAFQASKIAFSGGDESHVQRMETGSVDAITPHECKHMGSKASFKKLGLQLDIVTWSKLSRELMQYLLIARTRVDTRFIHIISSNRRLGKQHMHFERSGAKSVWGGSFEQSSGIWKGENFLGKCIDAIGDILITTQIVSKHSSVHLPSQSRHVTLQ